MVERPLVLFDGDCALCNGAVAFIAARDRGLFRFASLDSEQGRQVLAGARLGEGADSVVLLERGDVFERSTAALRIARRLRWPVCWLFALVLVPRPVRDLMYRWVARHRLRWFGRPTACALQCGRLLANVRGEVPSSGVPVVDGGDGRE